MGKAILNNSKKKVRLRPCKNCGNYHVVPVQEKRQVYIYCHNCGKTSLKYVCGNGIMGETRAIQNWNSNYEEP